MKKKILFIIPSMRGGGSERVISTILNYLSRDRFEIILVLLQKEGKYLDELPNDIEIIDLDVKQARYAIFDIIKVIKQRKPNIVFSTLGYLNILISIIRPFFSKKIKFIARESSIVSIQNQQEKYPKIFDFLFRNFYKNFDLIISQSNYMKNDLVENYKISSEKIVTINNPIDFKNITTLAKEEMQEKVDILVVGRVDKNKNFKDIIEILPTLKERTLTILGDGILYKELKELVQKLGLEKRVYFLGFQKNPYKYMKKANLLVLTSLYEGFPNVILEANALGTPVVAYSCKGGTREIVLDGQNGFLVECQNKKSLKKKIKDVVSYGFKSDKIIDMTFKQYNVDKIIQEYEEAYDRV